MCENGGQYSTICAIGYLMLIRKKIINMVVSMCSQPIGDPANTLFFLRREV